MAGPQRHGLRPPVNRSERGDAPYVDLSGPSARQQGLAVGGEGDEVNVADSPNDGGHFPAGRPRPQFDIADAAGSQGAAVGGERDPGDWMLVAGEGRLFPQVLGVENVDGLVVTGYDQVFAIWREGHASDIIR